MNALKQAQRFYELLKDWLGDGGKPVPKPQAQARANVCLICSMNDASRRMEEAFKGPAALGARRLIEFKNELQLRVEGEKHLHLCSVCDCVLKLKCHVPLSNIVASTSIETMGKFPKHCWIIKELNNGCA